MLNLWNISLYTLHAIIGWIIISFRVVTVIKPSKFASFRFIHQSVYLINVIDWGKQIFTFPLFFIIFRKSFMRTLCVMLLLMITIIIKFITLSNFMEREKKNDLVVCISLKWLSPLVNLWKNKNKTKFGSLILAKLIADMVKIIVDY